MATQLDLQDQEQLESLKAFWKTYGNALTWGLIVLLTAYAGWNGWNYWQREQAQKAGAMYGALEVAVQANDAARSGTIFADLKERYPKTVFAQQAGLAAAKVQFTQGDVDAAKASLGWVAENAIEEEYRTLARLRLAAVLVSTKQYDEALKQLDAATAPAFAGLVADRRGDVLLAAGKPAEARAAYELAWKTIDPQSEIRRLLEAKLVSLGVAPAEAAAASAASAAGTAQ